MKISKCAPRPPSGTGSAAKDKLEFSERDIHFYLKHPNHPSLHRIRRVLVRSKEKGHRMSFKIYTLAASECGGPSQVVILIFSELYLIGI